MTLLVFTDLDGSLLDHDSYSIDAALPAIHELQQRDFPLVMNSSKTATEIESLQVELGLTTPYICENGASLRQLSSAIFKNTEIEFGSYLSCWLQELHLLRDTEGYQFEGFSDWSEQQVSDLTGLEINAASRAKCREFSEPILWRDSASKRRLFEQQLIGLNLRLMEGGRFFSVQGYHDKSNAMIWLQEQYSKTGDVISVALGDSPNDGAMLNAAEVAIIIKSPKSERITLHSPLREIRTTQSGSAGWCEAMKEVLNLYDEKRLLPDS